jgi:high-affinity K+ transport system ATPase subunit B
MAAVCVTEQWQERIAANPATRDTLMAMPPRKFFDVNATTITVTGIGSSATINGDGNIVVINGASDQVALTGSSEAVTVSGSSDAVTVSGSATRWCSLRSAPSPYLRH